MHEYETACAYAVTVLQNNIIFNAVAAFEQYVDSNSNSNYVVPYEAVAIATIE